MRYLSISEFINSSVYNTWKQTQKTAGRRYVISGALFECAVISMFVLWAMNVFDMDFVWRFGIIPLILLVLLGIGFIVIYNGIFLVRREDPTWVLFGNIMPTPESFVDDSKKWKRRDFTTKRLIRLTDGSLVRAKVSIPCSHFGRVHMPVIAFGWFNNPNEVWAIRSYFANDEMYTILCKQSQIVPVLGKENENGD